uniref:Uncharacterized protein n=1 Tax=Panagrolaimus sp. ES5 TaxID=591445 RepID=A0AC34FP92_9BILA
MHLVAVLFLIPTLFLRLTNSQIYNKDFYLNRYLDSTMGNSGYYRPIYSPAGASSYDYYPTYHSSQPSLYHYPRDIGMYEYGAYPAAAIRGIGGYENYGARMPYGYYGRGGGNEYGYMNDQQPGMFRGALDGAIKGTIAGAFGL